MKQINVIKTGSLKAKEITKKGAVATIDVPEYEMGPEDVKIKVAYCSVCGSDPHLVEGIFGWKPPVSDMRCRVSSSRWAKRPCRRV